MRNNLICMILTEIQKNNRYKKHKSMVYLCNFKMYKII